MINEMYSVEKYSKILDIREYFKNYVNIDITLDYCKECPHYNNNWACPEFEENPLEYWKKYDYIQLNLRKIIIDDKFYSKTYPTDELNSVITEIMKIEKKADRNEFLKLEKERHGLYLSAGFCDICTECSKKDGLSCRFPDIKRSSLESIGALVEKTTTNLFNLELKWIDIEKGKLPEYLTLVTAIIY